MKKQIPRIRESTYELLDSPLNEYIRLKILETYESDNEKHFAPLVDKESKCFLVISKKKLYE